MQEIVDNVLMRHVDGLLSIPLIILALGISGVLNAGLGTLVLILGSSGWVTDARVIRGEVHKGREMEYVAAAYATGQTRYNVMPCHFLSSVISTATSLVASQIGVAILA